LGELLQTLDVSLQDDPQEAVRRIRPPWLV
jgi:hypothetical protein